MKRYTDPMRLPGRKSQRYYTRIYDPDGIEIKRSWASTGFDTLKEARAWVDTKRMEAALGPMRVDAQKTGERSFREVYEALLAEKDGKISATRYYSVKSRGDSFWLPAFGPKRIAEITPELITNYLRGRKRRKERAAKPAAKGGRKRKAKETKPRQLSAVTLNDDLAGLKALFGFAIRRGWLLKSPCDSVGRFTGEHKPGTRDISPEQEAALLACCRGEYKVPAEGLRNTGSRKGGTTTTETAKWEQTAESPEYLYPVAVTALYSGFRRRTLCELKWGHADLKAGEWEIPGEHFKVERDYHARMPAFVLETLKAYRSKMLAQDGVKRVADGAAIFGADPSSLSKAFRRAARRAGLLKFGIHSCRKVYVNKLRRLGVDVQVAKELVAHKSIVTTMRHYSEISADEKADAVRLFDAAAVPQKAKEA